MNLLKIFWEHPGLSGIINDTKWVSGFYLAAGADLLLHDAQYTEEEY